MEQEKNIKLLENGQILVEIEENIWVDYNTYFPKQETEEDQPITD
jgi:hypothetical protein